MNIIKVNKTYVTHTHPHTHTYIYTNHSVVMIWTLVHKRPAAVCERCDLPVRDPCCDFRLEQEQPRYG